MPEPWRVAIIDSGVDSGVQLPVLQQRQFRDDGTRVTDTTSTGDVSGHGTAIATIIASTQTPIELISAQVLNPQGRSTAATVAAALSWALTQHAQLIHLSLGLSQDRPVLAEMIAQTVQAGVILVASTPARGAPTFPASYAGVIRATGDARCTPEEISHLNTTAADFGACVTYTGANGKVLSGASMGAAHLTRFILSRIPLSTPSQDVRARLAQLAGYQGPECIRAMTQETRPAA